MSITIPDGPFEPTFESLERYTTPQWYLDAKFGIFIHWGAYCVPGYGNEWYPRGMYCQDSDTFKHHVQTFGPHTEFGYKDFIPKLTAKRFDAGKWAKLFREAGAKYVVPVAEHHDGFPMYDCSLTDWCATKMGPKRDIIGELAQAARSEGMVFGVSSHRAEHWWFFDGGMQFDSDVQDPQYAGLYGPAKPHGSVPDAEFLEDWLARTCELVDKYQPQVVWFDWWIEELCFRPYLKRFAAYYYNRGAEWGKGVAINYKNDAYPPKAAVFDIERGQLSDTREIFWQTDTAVAKNSWGYVHQRDYKTVTSIVHDLVDIVSKNGCLLLNIGPKPDGTIPAEEQAMLLEIGRWLQVNGEAVYGTRPWRVFGEGPTDIVGGTFNDVKRKPFNERDVRFTTRGQTLYATVMGIPEGGDVTIKSLSTDLALYRAEIDSVQVLGLDGPAQWTRNRTGLKVKLPKSLPCEHAFVVKVTRKGS